jgi:hypothetical protein
MTMNGCPASSVASSWAGGIDGWSSLLCTRASHEAGLELGRRVLVEQPLDRDVAAEHAVACQEYFAHAAAAEQLAELVAIVAADECRRHVPAGTIAICGGGRLGSGRVGRWWAGDRLGVLGVGHDSMLRRWR